MSDETMQAAMDQAYRFLAQRFLSSYELTQKMKLRGLAIPQDISAYDEVKAAYRVVEKKFGSILNEEKTPRVKVFSFLKYRGFSTSTIQVVCNDFYE